MVANIPLCDLAAQYRTLKPEIEAAVLRVLDSARYGRLDEIQAAILRVKLRHLDAWMRPGGSAPGRTPSCWQVAVPSHPRKQQGVVPPYYLYTIRTPSRDAVQDALARAGIESRVYYLHPVYRQPTPERLAHASWNLPRTEEACRTILSLPMYPELPPEAIGQVAENIALTLKRGTRKTP